MGRTIGRIGYPDTRSRIARMDDLPVPDINRHMIYRAVLCIKDKVARQRFGKADLCALLRLTARIMREVHAVFFHDAAVCDAPAQIAV